MLKSKTTFKKFSFHNTGSWSKNLEWKNNF